MKEFLTAKKNYVNPSLEVVEVEEDDVITMSAELGKEYDNGAVLGDIADFRK